MADTLLMNGHFAIVPQAGYILDLSESLRLRYPYVIGWLWYIKYPTTKMSAVQWHSLSHSRAIYDMRDGIRSSISTLRTAINGFFAVVGRPGISFRQTAFI
ncbi:hypothetical protein BDW22DRAFT_1355891 [Trametopsis cervina]|nr:hypothetical protein BDW22DRAFT_1355891 [Trametopsis cervina]